MSWIEIANKKREKARQLVVAAEGEGDQTIETPDSKQEAADAMDTSPDPAPANTTSTPAAAAPASVSSELGPVEKLFKGFQGLMKQSPCPVQEASAALSKLKVALMQHGFLLAGDQSVSKRQRLIARETLELASLLSVYQQDLTSFERHMAQVKTYYHDGSDLEESPRRWMLTGLNLLCLLSKNSTGQFHTQLELIPEDELKNPFIQHPVQLEQFIMEGSYNKVLESRHQAPDPAYQWFLEKLSLTVRNSIADCIQDAYDSVSSEDVQSLLHLDSETQVQEFAVARGWKLGSNGDYDFGDPPVTDLTSQIPKTEMMLQTLTYAKEMERIV